MRPPQFEWSNSFQDNVIETKFLACCKEFFVKRLSEKPCSLVMNFYEKVVRICWKYLILLRRGSPGLLCLEKAPGGGGSSEQNATILFDCLFILFEKSESKSSSPKFSAITLMEQNKAMMQYCNGVSTPLYKVASIYMNNLNAGSCE